MGFKSTNKGPDLKEIAESRNSYGSVLAALDDLVKAEADPAGLPSDWDTQLAKMGHDPQVKMCLRALTLPLISGDWSVTPCVEEGEEGFEQAQEQADFVKWTLDEMKGSVPQLTKDILKALPDGYSVCETNWRIIEGGKYSGMISIANIKPKRPSAYKPHVDDYDNVLGLTCTIYGSPNYNQVLPVEKFLLYSYNPQYGNPYGLSELRSAYVWSKRKDFVAKMALVAAEKYGCPTPVGKYAPGMSEEDKLRLKAALDKIMTETAIVVPDSVGVDFLEARSGTERIYQALLDYCDTQIAKGIIGGTLAVQEGSDGRGSYAQAKVHTDLLLSFVLSIEREVEETVLREQLVKRLCQYNFGTTEFAPYVKLAELDSEDVAALADMYSKLANSNLLHDSMLPVMDKRLGLEGRDFEAQMAEKEDMVDLDKPGGGRRDLKDEDEGEEDGAGKA